jgi:RNA polymerase sigma-70 factor (ECF subfamily)
MHAIATRYSGLPEGRFQRRASLDRDRRPGELSGAIARAKDGDEEALRYLYLRFAPNVYGFARGMLRDEHEAEDVTQQVFARLMTALANYEDRGVPFSSWLLRIAHNQAIDHIRRRTVSADDLGARTEAPDERRSRELAAALRDALEELPAVQRSVIVMRHVGGMTPGEIADRLDRTEDAVHGLHHRGRRALRQALAERDAGPMVAAA